MQHYIMASLPKYCCYGKATVGPFYCCWLRFSCQRYKIFHCCHGTATVGSSCQSYQATMYFVLLLTIIGTKYYEYVFLHPCLSYPACKLHLLGAILYCRLWHV
jgi:hypothetical protein